MATKQAPPQKVVPFETVALPEKKKPGWTPFFDEGGRPLGFTNPTFGTFRHSAIVDAEGNYLYDSILHEDGPVDPKTMQSAPNALIVPVEKRDDGYYVHCHREFRPVIRDHVAGVWGVEVVSIAGGFSKKGAKPSETALAELFEEQGVKVDEATMVRIGYGSPNRAFTTTCVEIWLAMFKLAQEAKPDEVESIRGNEPIRIDRFPFGPDLLVNVAVAMAAKHLDCIVAQPKKGVFQAVVAYLDSLLND